MPEKSLHEVPRAWREMYEKGKDALNRNNFDYAVTILSKVLESEPGFYDCREALRAAQFKKQGGGGGFFKRMLGTASSSPLIAKGQMALRKNPLEAIAIAEQVLNSDPANISAHKLVAEGALASDLPRTAALSLEIAFKHSPKDRKLASQLAQALGQIGQVDKAESIFRELLRANPDDPELMQELKNVAARKTLQQQGYESLAGGKGSYRDILRNKEEAEIYEQESRVVKTEDIAARLIREKEAQLAQEPLNLRLIRSLAELYTQKNEFDKALEYYQQLKQSELGNDPSIDKGIAETVSRKFQHQIDRLDSAAADYDLRRSELEKQRQEYLISECQQRMNKFPNDLQLRFELAVLYFNAGRISEAIQEFQRSKDNPHRKTQSLGYLGQCFAARGMYDLATRNLQMALAEKEIFDDEKKELTYQLGCVLEKMGRQSEAIEEFKKIYEVDIGYKDVGPRVDAFYSGQSGT